MLTGAMGSFPWRFLLYLGLRTGATPTFPRYLKYACKGAADVNADEEEYVALKLNKYIQLQHGGAQVDACAEINNRLSIKRGAFTPPVISKLINYYEKPIDSRIKKNDHAGKKNTIRQRNFWTIFSLTPTMLLTHFLLKQD